MQVFVSTLEEAASEVLVVPVTSKGHIAANTDYHPVARVKDDITHALQTDVKFKGKVGQTLTFSAPICEGRKIVLIGIGEKPDASTFRACGKSLYNALKETGYKKIEINDIECEGMKVSGAEAAAILADAVNAASYSFDEYITDDRRKEPKPENFTIVTENSGEAQKSYDKLAVVTEGEFLAADMGNEPGNVLYPESAARKIRAELGHLPGITIKVLDRSKMKEEEMGAALAVGKGSERPPCMVVIEYDGTNGQTKGWPLALVGKGVTFDSGGISLKPGAGMENMKMDMCGAAAVVGTMQALAKRGANTKVVAICGFAENMPGGKAYRPGDIITSRSGKTIEVGNTDAEGRLVLCDALDYIQDVYKPKTMVDLATLTGAILTSLGNTFSGVFTPDETLWKKLDKAGQASKQPGWRMPLHQDFANAVKGKVADLHNLGSLGMAGSSTAAEFLHAFVKASTKWAHLDIAGTAIPKNGIANGYGVRWLHQFIADNFEGKANDNKKAPTPAKPKVA